MDNFSTMKDELRNEYNFWREIQSPSQRNCQVGEESKPRSDTPGDHD
ncbi:hypothetical protein PoMZ_04149 [Pyricularia oryzae]|uniref:Uncharacterized protein n=1 Tax=Pyricularia oryzae TaxID=318829 RepID=A0A4P7N924_PYROR|nr:hypothetical protein PoMZ_04149 [Pyricularia oryzae]